MKEICVENIGRGLMVRCCSYFYIYAFFSIFHALEVLGAKFVHTGKNICKGMEEEQGYFEKEEYHSLPFQRFLTP
jgi:hypothetical protein